MQGNGLALQVKSRRQAGLKTFVIEPGEEAQREMGSNPFDATRRGAHSAGGTYSGTGNGRCGRQLLGMRVGTTPLTRAPQFY